MREVRNCGKTAASKKDILPEIVYITVFILSVFFKAMYFQVITKISRPPYFSSGNAIMAVSTFSIIMMLTGFVFLFFRDKRKIALMFLNIIISLLLLSDTLYYRYYSNPITIPVLYQAGLLAPVRDSVVALVRRTDIIFFLDIPISLAFIIFVKRFFKKPALSSHAVGRLATSALLLASGFIMLQICVSRIDRTNFIYDNVNPVKKLGILYFHAYDTGRYLSDRLFVDRTVSSADIQMLTDYFEAKSRKSKKYKGIASGKNLIVVQVEALMEFVIGKSVNGNEITPNMNNLIKESFFFDSLYYQVAGGNTSDAEFLFNTSLYPARESAVYFRYATNSFLSLPKLLKEQGYTSYAFHANNPNFWNRVVMYETLGFDKFISAKDYKHDEYVGWNGWSLSDASFYRQSLEMIDKSKPFYGFFITLSSHHPYTYFDGSYKDFDVGQYEGTYLGRYFKAINYADRALGLFIEEIKKQGLYDKTLLVVYGDHHAIPREHSGDLMKFLNMQYSDFLFRKIQKVPVIIRCPGVTESTRISVTGGQIDLLPTVGNLMGLDISYAMGRDLLNTDKSYAVLRNGSVITDEFLYLSELEEVYDIETGAVLPNGSYGKTLEMLQKELYISDMILQKDIFRFFKTNN